MKIILILAVIGALLGLLFSRDGKEGEDTLRGAKKGAKLGCFFVFFGLLFFLAFLAICFISLI